MSVDVLQEKIRKRKNPTMLELGLSLSQIPGQYEATAAGYGAFCRDLLEGLKQMVGAVRISFTAFAMLGAEGLTELTVTLKSASKMGYYVALEAPQILSPAAAQLVADSIFGEGSAYPCDGLVIPGYLGSDIIKPFLPYCKDKKKDIFVVARTANKSAPELQDLLSGSRLVHAVCADYVNLYGQDTSGKYGYTRVGILAAASAAGSLQTLRKKNPGLFLLVDGLDYPSANAKNCSYAFDKLGHGAAVCVAASITAAWKQAESDGSDFLIHAQAAADRVKKNLTRYTTIL